MENTELFISHGDNATTQKMSAPAAIQVEPEIAEQSEQELNEAIVESESVESEAAPQEEQTEEIGETLEVDHTIIEPVAPQEAAPDPLADIKAKIAGYPLPTPEIGNMRPPIPPRPGAKLQ